MDPLKYAKSHLSKANRPFDLLVFLFWHPCLVMVPQKVITFYFRVQTGQLVCISMFFGVLQSWMRNSREKATFIRSPVQRTLQYHLFPPPQAKETKKGPPRRKEEKTIPGFWFPFVFSAKTTTEATLQKHYMTSQPWLPRIRGRLEFVDSLKPDIAHYLGETEPPDKANDSAPKARENAKSSGRSRRCYAFCICKGEENTRSL